MGQSLFHRIPLSSKEGIFHLVVEIPKGSLAKYEYNEELDALFLDRMFKLPVGYPQNYGFFPQAWNRFDKDPMDGIVISEESFSPGVVIPTRVIGIIEMEDTGELDHKILTVPAKDEKYEQWKDISDIPEHIKENLVWFLSHYKDREKGKHVKVLGVKSAKEALQFLNECNAEYKKNHAA